MSRRSREADEQGDWLAGSFGEEAGVGDQAQGLAPVVPVVVEGRVERSELLAGDDDPIVREVRKLRDEYAKKFGYDLNAICRDWQQKPQRKGKQVIAFEPKRPTVVAGKK